MVRCNVEHLLHTSYSQYFIAFHESFFLDAHIFAIAILDLSNVSVTENDQLWGIFFAQIFRV